MVQPVDRWALSGVAALGVVAAADVATGDALALVPLLLLGPLVAALGAGPVRTAAVALVATLVALPLGSVDDIFGTGQHVVALTVVAAGGLLAALVAGVLARREERSRRMAEQRAREHVDEVRAGYLADVGRLLEAPPDPEAMLDAITSLAIPDMADLCIVDRVEDDALRGLAVNAAEPEIAHAVRDMRARHPITVGSGHPVGRVAATREALLIPWMEPEDHQAISSHPDQAARLTSLGYRTAIVCPLVARDRLLGVLSLVRRGDGAVRYVKEDLVVAQEVARRAALALDSAHLFHDLSETQGRLDAVLTNLAEAVTVQRPDGTFAFANDAAAELLGYPSAVDLQATPVAKLFERFLLLDEHGRPLDPMLLPSVRALAGDPSPGTLVTRSIDRRTGVEKWVVTKARALRGPDGEVTYAVSVMEDVTELRRSEREQRLLAVASKLLSTSLDIEVTLEKAAWAPVPELADWCWIDVPDERGRLVRRALAAEPDKLPGLEAIAAAVELRPEDPSSLGRTLVDHHPRVIEEITDEHLRRLARDARGLDVLRHAAVRSVLTVPLIAGDRVLGLMTLGTDTSARRLRPADVPLASELGRRAGIAVENARVHQTRTSIALTLQRSLLPPRLPVIPGVTIAARFRAAGTDAAERVGGDFYDLFPAGGAWFVVIGDVTGKGPEAAAITSLARYTMRTAAVYEPSPGKVLQCLNAALAADPDRRRLCTAICARVEPPPAEGGPLTVTFSCAGHPPPLLLREPGTASPVPALGPLLGAFDEDVTWVERTVALAPNEALLLYTDGVTDSRGSGDRFGVDRLERLCCSLAGKDADAIAEGVDGALLDFEEGPQRDDVALLVLRAGAPAAGRDGAAGASVVGHAPAGALAGDL